MLLSIVVPVYNKEKKISRCLESLRQIEEKDVEFIIVNDGSTDKTMSVCEYYGGLDARFHLINQENSGVSGARNTGIEHSTGKYISFVDADDEITENYNKLIEFLKDETRELVGFDYCAQKDEHTVTKHPKALLMPGENSRKDLFNSYLTGLSNSVWTNIYLANIIRDYHIRFTEKMTMGEDCEFNSNYFRHCTGIYYISEVCYKYYVDDDGSATHRRKISYLKDFERMYQGFLEIYQLEENLDFPFDYELYMRFVYGIIKNNSKTMTKEENKEFRKSLFYRKLMSHHYDAKKTNLKKWYIKSNLYRIV